MKKLVALMLVSLFFLGLAFAQVSKAGIGTSPRTEYVFLTTCENDLDNDLYRTTPVEGTEIIKRSIRKIAQ